MKSLLHNETIATGRQFFRRVFSRHRRLSCFSVLSMVMTGLLNGIGILLLIPLLHAIGLDVESAVPAGSTSAIGELPGWLRVHMSLPIVLLIFVSLSLLHAVLLRWQTVINAELKEDIVHTLRGDLYSAVYHSSWMFFVSRQSSDFTHALTDNLKRVTAGVVQGLRLCSTLLLAIAQIGATFFISPLLSLATITTGAILWPLLVRQNRMVSQTGRDLTRVNRSFFGTLANQLAGMKEAKSLGAEEQSISVFTEQSDQIRSSHLKMTEAMANTGAIYTIGAAVILSFLLYLAREVLHTPVTSLIALIVVFSRVLPRLRDIHSAYLSVLHMLPAFRSTMVLMDECQQHHDIKSRLITTKVTLQRAIRFSDVCFRYRPESQEWTLQNVNAQITAGQMTAIVGPSGAGKSTMADLLLTLITPHRGSILVDDQPLTDDGFASWRDLIGYVPQETYLFHGTIEANLLWAKPDATEPELTDALTSAAALDFVDGLPQGVNTVVGDRGVRLSGGERQRIALARALLRKPSLLILDEATSALDEENQRHIKDAVRQLRGELTVVTIAHRLSTVRDADQIIVMDAGRIVEAGSFDELTRRPQSRLNDLIGADGSSVAA